MSISMSAASGVYPRPERQITQSNARHEACQHGPRHCEGEPYSPRNAGDGPGRPNPLVRAMMQALQGLVSGAASASSGTGAAAGTNAGTNVGASQNPASPGSPAISSPSSSAVADVAGLKDAAMAFAHELYSALRGASREGQSGAEDSYRSEGRGEGRSHRGHGDYHHRHHAGHHGRAGRDGYSDLAQDLRRLANTLGETAGGSVPSSTVPSGSSLPAVPAPSTSALTSSGTTAVTGPAANTAPEVLDAPSPTNTTPAGGIQIEINISVKIQLPASAAPGQGVEPGLPGADDDGPEDDALTPPQESPLLAAFKRLMDKLAPLATGSSAGPDSASGNSNPTSPTNTSPLEKLRSFLLGVADALGSGNGSAFGRPATGGLLSVAA